MRSPLFYRVAVFVASGTLLIAPPTALAQSYLDRASSAVGDFFRGIATIFVSDQSGLRELDAALDSYRAGRLYSTIVQARALEAEAPEYLRDDARLLGGVAAARLGLRDVAAPALVSILDGPVSSYYPVALEALLDTELGLENRRAAGEYAERYFSDLWAQPRSAREGVIKGTFLEYGLLDSYEESRLNDELTRDFIRLRREDRLADRAVYLAGRALLASGSYDAAESALRAIRSPSRYWPFARYALAQARFGAGDRKGALEVLEDFLDRSGAFGEDAFVRDRGILLLAQLLHEAERDDDALSWLRQIDAGPFRLHALLLAAEIHTRAERIAAALNLLADQIPSDAEPKLRAFAATMEGQLRIKLSDDPTAVKGFEAALEELDRYGAAIDGSLRSDFGTADIRSRLVERQGARGAVAAWRRANLAGAIPDLLREDREPGFLSVALGGTFAGDGFPVITYDRDIDFDAFGATPRPVDAAATAGAEPSEGDPVFAAVYRRSFQGAVRDALERTQRLRSALRGEDAHEMALTLLDAQLALQRWTRKSAAPTFPGPKSRDVAQGGASRSEVLAAAFDELAGAAPADLQALRDEGRRVLSIWSAYQDGVIQRALEAEAERVREIRFTLQNELSRTLARVSGRS